MALTAEQQWKIAEVYEKASADVMGAPRQQRAAFARKAKRFRMMARIKAKKEAALFLKQKSPEASQVASAGPNAVWAPPARPRTIEEMLKRAREKKRGKREAGADTAPA
jgi:hypothetical protein